MSRVLIVEDDPAMSVALRDGFEFERHEVEMAVDGLEGFELASRGVWGAMATWVDSRDGRGYSGER